MCSCHVTYAFQGESTLYSCLNVKELLARSKREIWSLSAWNWTRTHNHLVYQRTLNHLAKLAKWLTSRFTLKRVRYMTRTHSQMHRTDKYSQHSSITWPGARLAKWLLSALLSTKWLWVRVQLQSLISFVFVLWMHYLSIFEFAFFLSSFPDSLLSP